MMSEDNREREVPMNGSGTHHDVSQPLDRRHSTTMGRNTQSLTVAVIELIAEVLDEDPLGLQPPLADVIDPDVLEYLDRSVGESEQTFTFTYRDLAVTATNRGTIHVSEM